MKFRPTTRKTVVADLKAFAAWLAKAKAKEREAAATWLNEYLDDVLADDAFGTEGQLDPRGDHRE